MTNRFEVFKGKGKQKWRFRIICGNGQILAHSEGYSRRENALGAIRSIKSSAEFAEVRAI